jgi:mono/diheme cytochrome c family protein
MKTWMSIFVLTFGLVFSLAACGGDEPDEPRRERRTEPQQVLRSPVPQQYQMMEAPENLDDAELVEQGRQIYHAEDGPRCMDCHGESGKGDGPVQTPGIPSVDITADDFQDAVSDQYIFWRIKTGPTGYSGRAQSPMTGHMQGTDEEIWALVAYVRSMRGR